jgi:predicted  nucleic acid-binding Zn-ribbon protein
MKTEEHHIPECSIKELIDTLCELNQTVQELAKELRAVRDKKSRTPLAMKDTAVDRDELEQLLPKATIH